MVLPLPCPLMLFPFPVNAVSLCLAVLRFYSRISSTACLGSMQYLDIRHANSAYNDKGSRLSYFDDCIHCGVAFVECCVRIGAPPSEEHYCTVLPCLAAEDAVSHSDLHETQEQPKLKHRGFCRLRGIYTSAWIPSFIVTWTLDWINTKEPHGGAVYRKPTPGGYYFPDWILASS